MATSQMYLDLMDAAKELHKRKSAGYTGDNPDPWANFRQSEALGVPAWKGALIRMGDKWSRIQNLAKNPDNDQVGESIEDTLFDIAAYAYIVVCLRRGDGTATSQDPSSWNPLNVLHPEGHVLPEARLTTGSQALRGER